MIQDGTDQKELIDTIYTVIENEHGPKILPLDHAYLAGILLIAKQLEEITTTLLYLQNTISHK